MHHRERAASEHARRNVPAPFLSGSLLAAARKQNAQLRYQVIENCLGEDLKRNGDHAPDASSYP